MSSPPPPPHQPPSTPTPISTPSLRPAIPPPSPRPTTVKVRRRSNTASSLLSPSTLPPPITSTTNISPRPSPARQVSSNSELRGTPRRGRNVIDEIGDEEDARSAAELAALRRKASASTASSGGGRSGSGGGGGGGGLGERFGLSRREGDQVIRETEETPTSSSSPPPPQPPPAPSSHLTVPSTTTHVTRRRSASAPQEPHPHLIPSQPPHHPVPPQTSPIQPSSQRPIPRSPSGQVLRGISRLSLVETLVRDDREMIGARAGAGVGGGQGLGEIREEEEGGVPGIRINDGDAVTISEGQQQTGKGRKRGHTLMNPLGLGRKDKRPPLSTLGGGGRDAEEDEREFHDDEVVDYLDVVDPEISALTTFSNVGNSLFIPPLPFLYRREPTVDIPSTYRQPSQAYPRQPQPPQPPTGPPPTTAVPPSAYLSSQAHISGRPRSPSGASALSDETNRPTVRMRRIESTAERGSILSKIPTFRRSKPLDEEQTVVGEDTFKKRPFEKLHPEADFFEGDNEEFEHELDLHVKQLLRKRERFKRGLRGFWKYFKTPPGFLITLYAFLVTFWGSAIVMFIWHWIPVTHESRRRYWIEICDQILCALFATVGIGMAPFRARDTWVMAHIVHYHRLTYKLRKEKNLPKLQNKNELPTHNLAEEEAKFAKDEEIVLSPEDQEKLDYYQKKFHESHTFYRSHETATHYPFPLKIAVTVVTLLDMHSLIQTSLGGVTWGIQYKHRPTALTASLISCSLSCSIIAGLLIWYGGSKTKKKDEVERRLRAALEAEAIERMRKEKEERERNGHETEMERIIANGIVEGDEEEEVENVEEVEEEGNGEVVRDVQPGKVEGLMRRGRSDDRI